VVDTVHHPLFARFYTVLARLAESAGTAEHRQELLSGVEGRIVEVGSGAGTNFVHYPATVAEVIAVEPESYLRDRSRAAALHAPVPVTVMDGSADALPVEDGWADAVVFSLVLCSVTDPAAALAEARRVLRPGGALRFYEHVRAGSPRRARLQDRVDRVWPYCAGGCHCNRDTPRTIEASGFDIEHIRRFDLRLGWVVAPVAPHAIGTAVLRAG
jgi:ubiquinone/menaquinone biosynthesis C-methylase UbiE